jgi:hypothetical protein
MGHSARRAWLLAALATALVTGTVAPSTVGAVDPAGSQGTDTSLALTASAVTVHGRGEFAGLTITVNQTQQLTNQAVSITWTGGMPTVAGPGRFGSRYLQIMQCWGDDDGSVPGNPGPTPEQCEQGAVAGTYGGLPGGLYPAGFALSRVISRSDWANYDPSVGKLDTRTTNVWLPFRAVDGTEVPIQTDPTFNPAVQGGNFWLNPYFNLITTNEIAGAVTGSDGKGAELLQVLTGVQSSGLGCGQKVQPVAGGGTKVPQCWIVVVPRGTPAEENVGTPFADSADQFGVATSPVSPAAWKNRIAIPMSFNPVDSPCALGADERRISGSELVLPAVASWQPSLCTGGSLPPFSFAPVSDAAARQQLLSGASGAPGMVVVSRPEPTDAVDPANPVVYSPLTLSGLVIGFNIERNPTPDAPATAQTLAGVRFAKLNLTPRLVAKLLTQSYRQAVSVEQAPDYAWMKDNPAHMGVDPDFLRFNPEFSQQQIADSRAFSGLSLPEGNSDAAQQVWQWILSDPEAKAFLNGQPDDWGMKVNPVYSLSASTNPTGIAFGTPVPTSFPKADPYCYQAATFTVGASTVKPPPLCGTDWMPYQRSFADTAQVARAAADGAKIVENPFAIAPQDVWTRDLPQFLGRRDELSLTDTPSAAQFGLQTASLSRAGDDGAARSFITADGPGLVAGAAAMRPSADPTLLVPDPAVKSSSAYPLTTLTYAAIAPLSLSSTVRSQYAAFIDYASGKGQVEGLELGQLPRGYAPLTSSLKQAAAAASAKVRTMQPPPTTTTTTTPTRVTTHRPPTTQPSSGGSSGGTSDSTTPPATSSPGASSTSSSTTTTSTTLVDGQSGSPSSSGPAALTLGGPTAGGRYAVVGLGALAIGSGLGALEITKRPRRRRAGPDDILAEADTGGLE